jgi:capsular polysaccharide transport system permease protein
MDGLDLPVADAGTRQRNIRFAGRSTRQRRRLAGLRGWMPFIIVVVLPTILAGVYYFGFAAHQYVSEARFVVRGPAGAPPGTLSTLLQGAGISRAQDDTFSVQDYILSRDALAELVKDDQLRTLFARPEADALSRFPSLFSGDNFEHLYKYYLRHVDVIYDSTTGISQLLVTAFRPEDAKDIANALLMAGENLVNRMNARQRENALREARVEVDRAEAKVRDVGARIAAFRNRETMLDPSKQGMAMLQGISDLHGKLALARTQLNELQRSSPNSPLIAATQRRISALQSQIDLERGSVAGSDHSMVPKITEFDALNLDQAFADRELNSATSSLETARVEAERQQLYLDLIVQPNQADWPAYPKRFADLAIVFATCFGLYTICKLLIAGVREHRLS